WKELRTRYTGTIDNAGDPEVDSPLPLVRDMREISARIRIAMYDARDLDDLASRLGLFCDESDVRAARRVLERFAPRAAVLWRARSRDLAAAVDGYAALVARPEVA